MLPRGCPAADREGLWCRVADEAGDQASVNVDAISTGALPLDIALSRRVAFREAGIVEIYGRNPPGKTTLVLTSSPRPEARRSPAFVDAEHRDRPGLRLGGSANTDELLVSQPDYGEQGAGDRRRADPVRCGGTWWPSTRSRHSPRGPELEGQMGDDGRPGQLMSQALRKLAGNLNRANTRLFTNQIREKIGVSLGSPKPSRAAGRSSLPQRLDIRRIETLKDGTEAVANRVREGGQEQGGGAVQAGGVRHRIRPRNFPRGQPDRPRHGT